MTPESIELSKRAGNIMSFVDPKIRYKLVEAITKAKSFDDLPQWAKDEIIKTEKLVKEQGGL